MQDICKVQVRTSTTIKKLVDLYAFFVDFSVILESLELKLIEIKEQQEITNRTTISLNRAMFSSLERAFSFNNTRGMIRKHWDMILRGKIKIYKRQTCF